MKPNLKNLTCLIRLLRTIGFVSLIITVQSGCAANKNQNCKLSETLHIHLKASGSLNPSTDGTSLPIVLRLHQLKQQDAHLFYNFESIWNEPSQVFGSNLLETREWVLFPANEKIEIIEKSSGAKYLSLIGNFRTLSADQWHARVKLPQKTSGRICKIKQDTKTLPTTHLHFLIQQYGIDSKIEIGTTRANTKARPS